MLYIYIYILLYATHSMLPSKNKTICFRKISLRVWAAIFKQERIYFFRTWLFSLFSAEPLYQRVWINHKIIFTVSGRKLKYIVKQLSNLDFLVFSDLWFVCLFWLFIEDNFWGEGGRPSSPLPLPPCPLEMKGPTTKTRNPISDQLRTNPDFCFRQYFPKW